LVVEMIQRVEDSALWQKYSDRRARIALKTDEVTQLEDLPGSGSCKTTRSLGDLNARLDSSINELYLFHGSSPAGVLGIGSSGFNLDLAGSSAGMMFGPGAYFAEASSKGDEYASEDPSGLFAGKCAMLLCRVVCGELFRVEAADPRLVQSSRTGRYDGTLGDREHAAGTYREFVVYDQAQVYPEYVIIYRRIFH
ncbi:Tnks, partial [Symbiodinium necroappetens]